MLNNNETIAGRYKVVRHLNRGMMANAYEALCVKTHKRVFFKEYLSPRPTVAWYRGFVEHQRELTRAIRGSDAEQYCLLPIETFERSSRTTAAGEERRTPATLYQTFEFIEGGLDVEKKLEGSLSWADRRMFASVFLFGLSQLHAAGVIHADLKPANLQIIEKTTARGPVRTPRLIDMDFSILAARRAPWHGHSGYIGTSGYLSPEHLAGAGAAPLFASDVFTAALILHELLGKGNPLRGLDDAEYVKRIRTGAIPAIELRGTFGSSDHDKAVIEGLRRCLAADPARRPASSALHRIITGTAAAPPSEKGGSPAAGARPGGVPTAPVPNAARLILASGGASLDVGVTTIVGRSLLQKFGSDAQFASSQQFRLLREGGDWFVEHFPEAKNETLLNGMKVVGRTRVKTGDRLGVGNSSRAIEKLPLKIELVT